jgi:hypothetical protein
VTGEWQRRFPPPTAQPAARQTRAGSPLVAARVSRGIRRFSVLVVHGLIGLISYGTDHGAQWQRGAEIVDLILKGAKAADIPVEQPLTTRSSQTVPTQSRHGYPKHHHAKHQKADAQ